MTPEQKQRIEQIRERVQRLERAEKDPHVKTWDGAYYGDVHFLLSLVKSQETDDQFVGPCVGCGHNNYDSALKECAQRWMEGRMSVVCGCPCAKHNSLSNVATSSRSACVEKVKSLAATHRAMAKGLTDTMLAELQKIRAEECDSIAEVLESLTLQEQEAKQP